VTVAAEVNPDRLEWASKRVWPRRNLHLFAPAVTRTRAGRPMEFSLLHLAWVAHVEYCWARGLYAGIFGAGSGGFVVTMAAWLHGRDPDSRVAVACGTEAQARLRARAIRAIATSPAFAKVFPDAGDGVKWSDHVAVRDAAGVVEDPLVEVRGLSSRPVGTKFGYLLFDDVTDATNTASYEQRETQKRVVQAAWLARLAPEGRVLWVSRPWNPDDASYALRALPEWCWLEQRMRADGAGYEQEVVGAAPDYLEATRKRVAEMLG
jgi:hypothetical protein